MRAKNMQVLTNETKADYPGIVIYGVGDKAHQQRSSDHNEDDTPGVRTPQTDSDNIPEHRALDLMLGKTFTKERADSFVSRLLSDPSALKRLVHIIWHGNEWKKSNGWKKQIRTEDPHNDHVHVAGDAADDDNVSTWRKPVTVPKPPTQLVVDGDLGPKTIKRWQQVMKTTVDGKIDEQDSELTRAVQKRLKELVDRSLVVDGQFGRKTIGALRRYLKVPAGSTMDTNTVKALQRRLNENRF